MGFVTQYFIKPFKRPLVQAPTGSFLIDQTGQIFSSTLPPNFPQDRARFIGNKVLILFRQAEAADLNLREVSVQYERFKLQAKYLPSGALVRLAPRGSEATVDN